MKNKSIISTIFTLSSVGLFVKLVGFVKQTTIASYFGADLWMDRYFLATGFIEGIGGMLAGSLSVLVITKYNQLIANDGEESCNSFVSNSFVVYTGIGLITIIFINVFAPIIAKGIAPSYNSNEIIELIKLLRVFSVLIWIGITNAILMAILNTQKIFLPEKLSGLFKSIIVIMGIVVFSKTMGNSILIYTTILMQIVVAGYFCLCARKYWKFKFTIPLIDRNQRHMFYLMMPLMINSGVGQINGIVDKAIGTSLSAGVISALAYSMVLMGFVTDVIVGTINTVALSHIAEYVAIKDNEKIKMTLGKGIILSVALLLPISIITVIMSPEIVEAVYMRGEFDYNAVNLTAMALSGRAIFLFMAGASGIVTSVLYSYNNTRIIMRNGILGIVFNIVLTLTLSPSMGIFGILFATGIASCIVFYMNTREVRHYCDFRYMERKFDYIKLALAGIGCAGAVYILSEIMKEQKALISFIICASLGFVIYGLILLLVRFKEAIEYKNKLLELIKIKTER